MLKSFAEVTTDLLPIEKELFSARLERLERVLDPGFSPLNWNSLGIEKEKKEMHITCIVVLLHVDRRKRPETAQNNFLKFSSSRCSVWITVSCQDKVARSGLTTFHNGKIGRELFSTTQFRFAFFLWSRYLKTVKCIRRPSKCTQRL